MLLDGEAIASGSIFGVTKELLRLTGSMNAPRKGNMSGKVSLDVLSFGTVYNLPLDGASVSKSDSVTRMLEEEFFNFNVWIGPVPVQVKAGVQGSAGFTYHAGLNPASAVAEFTPLLHSKVYLQAGVDLYGIAGVGLRANMTLINYDLSMYGSVRLWAQTPVGQTKPMLGIQEKYKIGHKLEMLNGNLEVYTYIHVPCWCLPPWERKEWTYNIWNWNGFTPIDGYLVNETHWKSLGIPIN
jgi:hypothetical protein